MVIVGIITLRSFVFYWKMLEHRPDFAGFLVIAHLSAVNLTKPAKINRIFLSFKINDEFLIGAERKKCGSFIVVICEIINTDLSGAEVLDILDVLVIAQLKIIWPN